MKVYTRTGDDGRTSLYSGGRVTKDHLRVEAYGTVDELSAVLGLLRVEPLPDGVGERLESIQSSLFDLGGALADPEGRYPFDPRRWSPAPLEEWIDGMDAELAPLGTFILPGGSRPAALAHLARTVCRRAERRVLTVAEQGEALPEGALAFLNRLSDALFVLARVLNARLGILDPQWRPGGTGPGSEGGPKPG